MSTSTKGHLILPNINVMIVTADSQVDIISGSNHNSEIIHNHLLTSPTQSSIYSIITELGI